MDFELSSQAYEWFHSYDPDCELFKDHKSYGVDGIVGCIKEMNTEWAQDTDDAQGYLQTEDAQQIWDDVDQMHSMGIHAIRWNRGRLQALMMIDKEARREDVESLWQF